MAARKKMTRKERSRINKAKHKARKHRVRGHLAKNAGKKPGSHRVRGHLAKRPARRKKAAGKKRSTRRAPRRKTYYAEHAMSRTLHGPFATRAAALADVRANVARHRGRVGGDRSEWKVVHTKPFWA